MEGRRELEGGGIGGRESGSKQERQDGCGEGDEKREGGGEKRGWEGRESCTSIVTVHLLPHTA